MQPASKPEGSDPMRHPRPSKDRRGSASGSFSLASPPPVDPDPAYIAASAASHIVTGDHQNQTEDWYEDRGNQFTPETAVVSSTSLALVNAFLDQLLYNFLASARSTSIASLRPAVSEVLRPRLAKDAINGADEELHEFLGGGDEEELSAFHNGLEPRGPWDLNLVWRRTRLRCMVYTRLGDMEEEDEETFVEREQLDEASQGYRRLSRGLSIVSPAAAIFLTSILEFVGEQALMVAGDAAHTRVEARRLRHPESEDPRKNKQRVIVEDIDMQKIAFNTTLGRLWRSWKKGVRSPSMLGIQNLSRDSARSNVIHNPENDPTSGGTVDSEVEVVDFDPGDTAHPSTAEVAEKSMLSKLPPSGSTKVNGGEDSNLHFLTEDDHPVHKATGNARGHRPSSMISYSQRSIDSSAWPSESVMQRRRSSSLPALPPAPYISLSSENSSTPREASISRNTSSSSVHKQGETRPTAPSLGREESTTVTTLYDGTIDSDNDAMPSDNQQSQRGSQGMSKEEFDREMLQLVKEMRPQRASDLLNDEPRIANGAIEKSLPSGSSETDNQPDAFDDDTRNTYAELPANRGIDQSTLEYWRGAAGSPSSMTLRKRSEESEGAYYKPRSQSPGGQQRRPTSEGDNDYGRVWEHQMPFFYRGPSTSHSNQHEAVVQRPTKELQHDIPLTTPVRDAETRAETDNSAPPLTPLRELMEAAHDTSDEASSVAPSQDASRSNYVSSDQYQASDIPRSSSLSQALPQARPASKLSDLRSQLPAVNTNTDHAAVQRVLPSPVSAREPLTPVGRTSTSSNRGLRLVHTSSSATSQVSQKLRGIVGRDSTDSRRSETPRDSSEGSGSFISDKPSLKTPRAGDAQKSFDQLIKSDETIQYTLTPQNMREMESPEAPRWNHTRNEASGPEEIEQARPTFSRSKPPIKGLNGLRANPAATVNAPEQTRTNQAPSGSVVPQSKAARPSTSHSHSGVPREARTKEDSFREFADFLRSTGPAPGSMAPQKSGPPIAEPRPIKALPATSPRPDSGDGVSKRITKQNPNMNSGPNTGQQAANPAATNQQQNNRRTDPVKSKKPIPKLQPRDATTSSDSTLELAEFLRQGPTEGSAGRLRLPRTGEPPRLVAGTNDVQRTSNGKSRDGENSRTSVASTHVSSVPSKSIQSVNSRTGLLESSNTAADGRGSTEKRPAREDETPYPVRKQRRVKDPYAFDTDSENDEDDQAPEQRQEESLIDFLNSVAPPPSPPANQAAFPAGAQSSKSAPPQKSHYPSMRERLTRNGNSTSSIDTRSQPKQSQMGVPSIVKRKSEIRQPTSSNARGKAPMPRTEGSIPANRGRPEASRAGSNNNRTKNNHAPQLPPFNPRETSPHLISQVGSKFDTYRITQPTYAAHVDRERNGARRSPTQHYQARSEHDPVNGMGDLADFLRNSEPPPEVPKRPVSPPKEKDGGFGRMFSRRKKSIH